MKTASEIVKERREFAKSLILCWRLKRSKKRRIGGVSMKFKPTERGVLVVAENGVVKDYPRPVIGFYELMLEELTAPIQMVGFERIRIEKAERDQIKSASYLGVDLEDRVNRKPIVQILWEHGHRTPLIEELMKRDQGREHEA